MNHWFQQLILGMLSREVPLHRWLARRLSFVHPNHSHHHPLKYKPHLCGIPIVICMMNWGRKWIKECIARRFRRKPRLVNGRQTSIAKELDTGGPMFYKWFDKIARQVYRDLHPDQPFIPEVELKTPKSKNPRNKK